MKIVKVALTFLSLLALLGLPTWYTFADREDNDPDLPAGLQMDKAEYLRQRDEYIALLRGFDTAELDSRAKAIDEMERSEKELALRPDAPSVATWHPLGPAPIPNGLTTGRTDPVSGRVTSIAVHPTNANIVYVGTAQGGLYRSLDGGASWVPIMDSALSLAIGAITIAPSDPTTVFVGTGEPGFCPSCFFGAGVYRITNADSASPTLSAPLRLNGSGQDVFSGRSVGKILVNPTDPNIIFVGTDSGTAGIAGSTTGATLPLRGLYRSTNAMSASPVFQQLTVSAANADRDILSGVLEPGNPARMFVTLVDSAGNGDGGIYFSTNADTATPTFTKVFATGAGSELGRAELSIQKTGTTVTVFCANGTSRGTLSSATYDSTAPGTPTFTSPGGGGGFCSYQCFYDIALAVDPTNAAKVYLGGSPSLPFGFSTNGGATFTTSATGLHVDSHAITVAPSNSNVIYFGSDGGVWKSTDAGLNWVSLNNSSLSSVQFESIAVHPVDRNYTLGGTQDNGTLYLFPDGVTWTTAIGGDGGMVVIDSNSTSSTNVKSYHTFAFTGDEIGFQRSTTTQANGTPIYGGSVLGCGGIANGISCFDSALFYPPLVLGPNATGSTGNTVYFGSNKLYRSIDQGTTMTVVSQTVSGNVSAIAIAPLTDDVRLIGTTTGRVLYSNTSAATTMTDITGAIPARLVGRIAIDPTNSNTAYVALGGFGIPNQHVMKSTNLNAATPTWTNAGSGIPDVPTNGLVIDPANPQQLFAGTDIGVFRSLDGGATWTPFSNGLPRVAVFQIVLQPSKRILRIATHGRGIFEYNLAAQSAPADFDGDGKSDVSVFRPSTNIWYLNRSTAGFAGYQFGAQGDQLTPADFTGDGKADIAVWRPSDGVWYIMRSEDSTFYGAQFGTSGDIPVPADFDGDGKADQAVFRPSNGTWYLQRSTAGFSATQFGTSGDIPTLGDFDGDGKADVAVFRPSEGVWYRLNSSTGGFFAIQFGTNGDKVVPADYTGDGKTDIAVWRPSDGTWYILRSEDLGFYGVRFGTLNDLPVPGDYDGDGKADVAVYRPSEGNWYLLQSTSGFAAQQFGLSEDKPTPNAFVY